MKQLKVKIKFKVAKYSKDRLHIELPTNVRDNFKAGEEVEVKKLRNTK